MKISKFYNETFEVTLELVLVYDRKSEKNAVKHLQEKGFDLSDAKDLVKGAAFCTEPLEDGVILIFMNLNAFEDSKEGRVNCIMYLQHECNHFRQYTLESIKERIDRTDLEAHLRISDWAFKKCMSTKFFKSLLK